MWKRRIDDANGIYRSHLLAAFAGFPGDTMNAVTEPGVYPPAALKAFKADLTVRGAIAFFVAAVVDRIRERSGAAQPAAGALAAAPTSLEALLMASDDEPEPPAAFVAGPVAAPTAAPAAAPMPAAPAAPPQAVPAAAPVAAPTATPVAAPAAVPMAAPTSAASAAMTTLAPPAANHQRAAAAAATPWPVQRPWPGSAAGRQRLRRRPRRRFHRHGKLKDGLWKLSLER